jgi:sugar diacid utilization regulator
VRAGDELLGSIWVLEASRPLGPDAEAALRDAAPLAALHLLRSRAADDLERRRRSDLLRATLDGRATPEALAASMGVSPATALTVVALELLVEPASAAALSAAERAVSLVTLHCEAYRRSAVAVAMGNVVHIVIAESGASDRAALVRFVTDLVGRTTESLRVPVRVAIGSTVDGVAELLASRHEASAVLRALQAHRPDAVVATIDDVRSHVVLHALQDLATRQPELRDGKVAGLAALDAERQTEYVATLRAYLDHFGDVPAAATALRVHPNTFRYRLRRLVEVSGLDLGDPVERLVAHLQLTLL